MNPRVYNGTYTGLKNERFVRFLRFLAISVHIPVYRENLREERGGVEREGRLLRGEGMEEEGRTVKGFYLVTVRHDRKCFRVLLFKSEIKKEILYYT